MAQYKSEVLYARYRRRLRPRSHYSLGRLPQWLRVARRAPRLVNALSSVQTLHPAVAWLAGVDARRQIPAIGPSSERSAWRAARRQPFSSASTKQVVLFIDTFTNSFTPHVVNAVIEVLQAAGYQVHVPLTDMCCGLTWISTGQLDGARSRLDRTAAVLHPYVSRGMSVVGIEPSCTAALRSDLTELVGGRRAADVSAAVKTLAELLVRDDDYEVPDLTDVDVVAQPHCHHHAVLGWQADRTLLERGGARVASVGGCCGLAGNFGAERGHYDVSVAVAETQLLPALRRISTSTVVLADGFSCRTQIEQLSDKRGMHLAELLSGRPAS